MPTIELPEKKPRTKYKPQEGATLWANQLYNTVRWRKLRDAQLQLQPLCEMHLLYDMIVPAVTVHHINEISNAGSRLEAMDIAFDSNNLMSLCRECHERYHGIKHSNHSISKEDSVFLYKYRQLCKQKNGNQ